MRPLAPDEREDLLRVSEQVGRYLEVASLGGTPMENWQPKDWDCMIECAVLAWMEARDERRTKPQRGARPRR